MKSNVSYFQFKDRENENYPSTYNLCVLCKIIVFQNFIYFLKPETHKSNCLTEKSYKLSNGVFSYLLLKDFTLKM